MPPIPSPEPSQSRSLTHVARCLKSTGHARSQTFCDPRRKSANMFGWWWYRQAVGYLSRSGSMENNNSPTDSPPHQQRRKNAPDQTSCLLRSMNVIAQRREEAL
ncbi:hypothetical protein E4U45_005468 [Claviceps purpurea]|nr:hypothetical protein E4U45_005468 [Claviceps purpurea]